jgi:hypothetical protein
MSIAPILAILFLIAAFGFAVYGMFVALLAGITLLRERYRSKVRASPIRAKLAIKHR